MPRKAAANIFAAVTSRTKSKMTSRRRAIEMGILQVPSRRVQALVRRRRLGGFCRLIQQVLQPVKLRIIRIDRVKLLPCFLRRADVVSAFQIYQSRFVARTYAQHLVQFVERLARVTQTVKAGRHIRARIYVLGISLQGLLIPRNRLREAAPVKKKVGELQAWRGIRRIVRGGILEKLYDLGVIKGRVAFRQLRCDFALRTARCRSVPGGSPRGSRSGRNGVRSRASDREPSSAIDVTGKKTGAEENDRCDKCLFLHRFTLNIRPPEFS